jgi:hypothetical protein
MIKKMIACLTLICFVGFMQGCMTTKWISTQDFLNKPKGNITQIRMQDDTVIKCKNKSSKGASVENNTIVYLMEDGSVKKIPISEVKELFIKKSAVLNSIFLGLLGMTVVGLIVAKHNLESI